MGLNDVNPTASIKEMTKQLTQELVDTCFRYNGLLLCATVVGCLEYAKRELMETETDEPE